MTSVAAQQIDSYFAMIPERYVYSDHLSHNGIRILALLDASKRDYTGWDGKGMKWPVFTVSEIAEKLHISEKTVKREVAQLKKFGFVKTRKTIDGNEYELISVVHDDDTMRGNTRVSDKANSLVPIELITCEISAGAFRLWLILESVGKGREWFYISQDVLAGYMGVSQRHIRNWLDELKNLELVEVSRPDRLGANRYRLSRNPVVIDELPEVEEIVDEGLVAQDSDTDTADPVINEIEQNPAWNWQEVSDTAMHITKFWLEATVGPSWKSWSNNVDTPTTLYQTIYDVAEILGPETTRNKFDGLIDLYGTDHDAEFILKIIDEILDDIENDEDK
ncbi:helix-turn-helix domain-containing protein [Microbispora bryophytorum]|uniref:helix-turn-helix domain-containing protein n=1 Tax=Microbispora bryophytorum TaxID=1460882 RepID=UPI0033DF9145